MSRRARIAGATVAGLSLLGLESLRRAYAADIEAAYRRLDATETTRVETSVGTVEYHATGSSVPVLVSHGIVGGFDQALATGRNLFGDDAEVVGVSRFGYLGSELPDDASPEAQAAAFAEVLDHHGLDAAVVVGVSAGGAPAIRFALDYPDRALGLVLVGAALPHSGPISGPTGPPAAVLQDPLFWLLTTYTRPVLFQLFGLKRAAFRRATRAEQAQVVELFETLLPVEPRRPGVRNDERVTNRAMIDRYDEYPLEDVRVPTLLLHAEDDPLASFEDAERAADRIPEAELRAYEDGGHLLFGHGDDVERTLSAFLDHELDYHVVA